MSGLDAGSASCSVADQYGPVIWFMALPGNLRNGDISDACNEYGRVSGVLFPRVSLARALVVFDSAKFGTVLSDQSDLTCHF